MRKNMRLTYTRDGQDSFYSCKHLCTWLKTTSINNSTELGKKKKKSIARFLPPPSRPVGSTSLRKTVEIEIYDCDGNLLSRKAAETRKIYIFLVAEGSGLISLANGSRDKSKNNVCKKKSPLYSRPYTRGQTNLVLTAEGM